MEKFQFNWSPVNWNAPNGDNMEFLCWVRFRTRKDGWIGDFYVTVKADNELKAYKKLKFAYAKRIKFISIDFYDIATGDLTCTKLFYD